MQIIYENITIAKEYSKLIEYINNTTNLHQYFESSFGKTKLKNYCGFLATNENCYFIAPKITNNQNSDLNIFIYMLLFANNIKISNIDTINLATKSHKIFELFIKIFSDTLLNELKKGLFKKYITMQENLKMLRGKYIIDKNFTNFYHQNIYCEYDEFSEDNELNRFFLYAIKVFKKYSNYINLSRCELILSDVKSHTFDYNRFNFNFNRLSNRYKDNYRLNNTELKNYYIVIDEINRANISKVFGELITLIEEDKRDKLEVILPYSKEPFSVPSNLYIIGTMNSTDKSIALLDVALRRRFTFIKMEPNENLVIEEFKDKFTKLNEFIANTLGEDYKIGHSYFINIDTNDLDFVIDYKIKPLLEEYFYGNEEGLQKALALL